jgi:hypothetical protein
VLVCSADHRLLAELQAQLLAWDCAVLAKPFELDALLNVIQTCLTGHQSAASSGLGGHAAIEPPA